MKRKVLTTAMIAQAACVYVCVCEYVQAKSRQSQTFLG